MTSTLRATIERYCWTCCLMTADGQPRALPITDSQEDIEKHAGHEKHTITRDRLKRNEGNAAWQALKR
jgi:hypothetical protein